MNGTTVDMHGIVTAFDASKYKGLKQLRATSAKEPEYACSNCKCKRYSPCTCMKKGEE